LLDLIFFGFDLVDFFSMNHALLATCWWHHHILVLHPSCFLIDLVQRTQFFFFAINFCVEFVYHRIESN
jgi:hypothetical protein